MATYLELVNRVLRRFNEVPLSETNFDSTRGFHAQIKDAVNDAIKDIAQRHPQWPFFHVRYDDALEVGEQFYDFPKDAMNVDFDTFYLSKTTTSNAKNLEKINYDDWAQRYRESDINAETSDYSTPQFVFRAQNMGFGVSPKPDKAYTVNYEYWAYPSSLTAATDEPAVPDQFSYVIVEGASAYASLFRADAESAAIYKKSFENGVSDMSYLLLGRDDYVRSTVSIR